ncbi:protein maelstrom homolog [Lingula anatina]|uniref:Protein maelstrom homolog n=1 Tax=Lingula anatina TaxID=7574 RepID=A0A1S3IAP5_LINAN|nr:protein maelstrom homolog [Lingula anatina]|eukprot:XP_013395238.1 protein maelstrom homolog [Lingula anatina]
MPKKQQRNGFYFYMQDLMPELRREGRVFPNGMADVVPVAHPRWKMLSEQDKARYEQMAKEWKAKMRGAEGDKYRVDNVGNLLSERKDEKKEYDIDRMRERKQVRTKWPAGQGVIHEKFYFISFQYLCETEEGYFIPVEVGLIEYSLNNGITKHLHRMIEPGPIPTGYRYTCQNHSDETHQIPIERFEYADKNYMGLWIQMENFLNPNQEKKESPPLYCQKAEWKCVNSCLEWLHAHACLGYANRLRKVYELDGLVQDLYAHSSASTAIGECTDLITTSAYDYEINTRCDYHEDKEVKHCALATVRRFAYALSDSLSEIYDFEITAQHLPVRPDDQPAYTLIEPASIKIAPLPAGRNRSNQSPSRGSPSRGRGQANTSNNGSFPARDFRLNQNEAGSQLQHQQYVEPSQTIRRPNVPGVAAQSTFPPAPRQAPWAAKPVVNQGQALSQLGAGAPRAAAPAPHPLQQMSAPAPWAQKAAGLPRGAQNTSGTALPPRNPSFHGDLQDAEEFPSLGGPASKAVPAQAPKFAGRGSAAPPAQAAPKPPVSWSSQVQYPSANTLSTVAPLQTTVSSGAQGVAMPRPAWGAGSQAGSPGRGQARGRGIYNPGATRPPPGFANPPVGRGAPCAMVGRGYAIPPGMGRGLLGQPSQAIRLSGPVTQNDVSAGIASLDLEADENWG